MPRSANYPFFPGSLPNFTFPPLPPGFPSPDKGGAPIPFPMPPGMPGVPGPPGLPGPAPVPMPMHMPMMPMPLPGPAHKVPVIVMPFYSPEGARKPAPGGPRHKKRRVHVNKKRFPPYHSESDTDTDTGTSETDDSRYSSSDTSSSDGGGAWWGGRRSGGRFGGKHAHQRRRHKANADFLTPIIQYVTKDGYVIFEKKISKDQASDWLQEKKERNGREYNKPPKDENKSKNEEEEALQEYDNATTETAKRRNANAKAISEIEKIKGRMHKTPHRHQPKKLARKEK
ncbi:unnamed protein product, partial [Iphiclides podalirius]